MAFIPAPNAIRVCLQMEWASQTVEICIGILKNSAVTAPDLVTLTDALEEWRQDEIVPVTSAPLTFRQWYALSLTSATAPTFINPITVATTGAVGGASVPNNVALVTTFQTDLRGRSYRGRAYLPGISADALVSSTEVDTGTAAAVNAAFGALNGALPLAYQHVVISNQNNNVMRTVAARTPVTSYRTEVRLDSQRRRLEGRGT